MDVVALNSAKNPVKDSVKNSVKNSVKETDPKRFSATLGLDSPPVNPLAGNG
jgi:hypothetical protein